jgi:uncharacterized protein
VQAAAGARRPTHLVVAWLVAVVANAVLVILTVHPLASALLGHPAEGSMRSQVLDLVTNGANLLVLAAWVALKEGRPFRTIGFIGSHGPRSFLAGMLGGGALFAIPITLLWATGHYASGVSQHTITGAAAWLPVVLLAPTWMVQSTAEEAVMRGYLLQLHALRQPAWAAILITSVGFAALHLDLHPLVLANIVLVAVLFCFLALAQGSIWLVAGLHTGWNLTQGSICGIPVSGYLVEASLLTLGPNASSPEWITGGSFGVEGSAVTTAVLAVATALAYRFHRRVDRDRARASVHPGVADEREHGAVG